MNEAKEFANLLEVFLIDDGSQDDSLTLCEKIAAEIPFVKVIAAEHGGISAARNVGLSCAGGEYILFADADDYVYLKELITFFNDRILPDLIVFSFDAGDNRMASRARALADRHFCLQSHNDFLEKEYKSFAGSVWNKIFKRDMIETYNLRFQNENVIGNEDILFNLMYFLHCREMEFVKENFYYYYIRRDSACHRRTDDFEVIKRFCNCAIYFREYALKWGLNLSEFFYYFLVKQLLLAERSYSSPDKQEKNRKIAVYLVSEEAIRIICLNAAESGMEFFVLQEKWDVYKCRAAAAIRTHIIYRNIAAVQEKLEILF
ncbi:glycosyltransferase [Blautia marasmi]|uniref:glycosyltransferase n=1 Tax=Blautia marasmi TaxID=1917868 RepID=UPI002221F0D5|nr:glycosyltransferase [Blautia marasmi]